MARKALLRSSAFVVWYAHFHLPRTLLKCSA